MPLLRTLSGLAFIACAGCGSEPVSLLDGWEGKARDMSFGGRSLPALTPEFPSELEFPVRLPAEPFLDFSIAVEAPEDIARGRVRFRIELEDGADDYTVFEDVVRARRGNRWRHRSVNLAAWRGREVKLTLEARPDSPGAVGAWAERVQVAWGDPVLFDRAVERPQQPSIVFILVDTLRRDYLGAYGFRGDISPNLDWLAKESVLFENAFTQAPWTKPSIATLFTSLYPDVHGLDNHGGLFGERESDSLTTGILPPEALTMAELFRASGYRTGAFVANRWLERAFGFEQGFDTYEVRTDGDELLDGARGWLESRAIGEPFFLYLHLMDVHGPYDAPEDDFKRMHASVSLGRFEPPPVERMRRLPPHLDGITWFSVEDLAPAGWGAVVDFRLRRSRTLRARYAANVRDFDRRIGPFLQMLRTSRWNDEAYVVLSSDHGEELLEHGGWDHGFSLYDDQIRIPLLIRAPGASGAGRRVNQAVNLIDLMPTLSALVGIEPPGGLQGRDQSPLMDGDGAMDFASFSTATKHRRGVYSVRNARYKLIYDQTSETSLLFDLESDPAQYRDLADDEPAMTEELLRHLAAYFEDNTRQDASAPELAPVPEELRKALEALGYLSDRDFIYRLIQAHGRYQDAAHPAFEHARGHGARPSRLERKTIAVGHGRSGGDPRWSVVDPLGIS